MKKNTLILLFLLISFSAFTQEIANIGYGAATPASGAGSTTYKFFYETDTNFAWMWDGSAWRRIATQTFTGATYLPLAGGTMTGSLVPTNITGTTTNNNAAAGAVGEYVSSLVASGSAVSLTTATGANITSISLTAGDWDVSGNINFAHSSATVTIAKGGIASTSATVPTDGTEVHSGVQLVATSATDGITMATKRFSLSGTTTVYLVAEATFTAGTSAAYGSIHARRVR